MSTVPSCTTGQRVPERRRKKHSIRAFVFSSARKEAEPPASDCNPACYQTARPRIKSIDYAFLNRYGKMPQIVEEKRDERVCFIHNHKIIRASKVYINVYHLWKKWLNRALKTFGLGGGYHTAIEIMGKEYHFGGCNKVDSGIFESRPLHQMKFPNANDFHMTESDWLAVEMAMQLGPLKERQVIGLWSGSEADIDLLMRHLKEKGNWKGLNYKLLSFNCNHFVRDACDILLKHSKHFHPAKGMTSSDNMVPPYLFKLTKFIKSRYLRCVVGTLEEDEIPPPEEEQYAFRGRARYSVQGVVPYRDFLPSSSFYETTDPENIQIPRDRRQSLPELRQLRLQALDHRSTAQRRVKSRPWNEPTTSSIMNTDPTDPTSWSIPEESSTTSLNEFVNTMESKQSDTSGVYAVSRTKTVKASSSRTDQMAVKGKIQTGSDSCDLNSTLDSGNSEKRPEGMPPRYRSCNPSDDSYTKTALGQWNSQAMHSSNSYTNTGDERTISRFLEDGLSGRDLGPRYTPISSFQKERDSQSY